jgi:hypothetical protein
MPRHAKPKLDNTILEMAVRGYEAERDRISAAMAEIRSAAWSTRFKWDFDSGSGHGSLRLPKSAP